MADQIRVSKRLVQLDCDTPLDFALDSLEVRDPEADTLLAFLSQMEFRTLTNRVAERLGAAPPAVPAAPPAAEAAPSPEPTAIDHAAYETLTTPDALSAWVASIRDTGLVAVDTETTGLDEMQADLVGISLCVAPGRACYIPAGHVQGGDDLFGQAALVAGQLPLAEVLAALKPVLEDDAILKIGQNLSLIHI